MMSIHPEKRIAIVTGAAGGIGAAVRDRLVADGLTVVATDIRESEAAPVRLDVTSPSDWQSVVDSAVHQHGRIDVLVNNAGIAGRSAPVWDLQPEEWREVVDADLSGVFYGCRAVIPSMRSRRYGRIVNVASIAGKEGNPNAVPYSASKAGVIGLTKALAKEVVADNIIVNCITPAVIETEMLAQVSDEHRAYMLSKIPMGRMGQPQEVAALVSWLCSDECSYSTGAVFDISGGRASY